MFDWLLPLGIGLVGVLIVGFFLAALGLVYTVLWVWMLVDSIKRPDSDFPGSFESRKVLWIVAVAIVHPAALVYFFVVYLKARRMRDASTGMYAGAVAPPVPPMPDNTISA